jgi:hypothetical protein
MIFKSWVWHQDTRAAMQDTYDAIWMAGFGMGVALALAAVGAVWLFG